VLACVRACVRAYVRVCVTSVNIIETRGISVTFSREILKVKTNKHFICCPQLFLNATLPTKAYDFIIRIKCIE